MSDEHPSPPAPPPERRSFLKWACHGLGGLFGAVLGIPAIAYLLDPRNRAAPQRDFKTVAQLDQLEKGVPFQAVVRDVRQDAWTLHPNDVLGRVWLIRRDGDKVDAFTTICPHLGCSINYEKSADRFICPCHNAQFDLEGKKLAQAKVNNPAPRDMDSLDCQVDKDQGIVQVRYANFYQLNAEQIEKK